MLRPGQIDLDEVARGRAAIAADGQPHWFLDLLSGHVVRVSPDDPVVVDRSIPRDWQVVHPGRSAYHDMGDFVDGLSTSAARDRLDRALSGRLPHGDRKAAARRFESTITELPELIGAWAEFRAARARRDAVRWLTKMGYVNAEEADQALAAYPDPPAPRMPAPIDADAIARAVAADLRELYGDRLQQVLLFGSYARGTAVDGESDLDLLVVLNPMDSPYAEIDVMGDVLWEHTLANCVAVSGIPVSAADYTDRQSAFLARVRAEARAVA